MRIQCAFVGGVNARPAHHQRAHREDGHVEWLRGGLPEPERAPGGELTGPTTGPCPIWVRPFLEWVPRFGWI